MMFPLSLQTLRLAGIGFVVVTGVSMCTMYGQQQQRKGAEKVISSVAKQTEKISAKARKARDAARAPGSLDRLRQSQIDCRDCKL